jgi:branched-chain amino acid transport system substrate-binding protein
VPIEEGTFAEDFEAETGAAPGAYAAEGYDAMNIFLDAFADGARTREEVEDFVDSYDEAGLTKQLAFDDNGDIAVENVVIWAYKVEDGKLVPDQEISLS